MTPPKSILGISHETSSLGSIEASNCRLLITSDQSIKAAMVAPIIAEMHCMAVPCFSKKPLCGCCGWVDWIGGTSELLVLGSFLSILVKVQGFTSGCNYK